MAMLTMRTRRFLNKTGSKININGSETKGFNKSKVECYNYHKKGHFTGECKAPRKNRNRELVRSNVTMETTETKALVAQDGLGYEWSDQDEEGPTNFTLMAYTSSGSSSSSSLDSESLERNLKAEKERDDLKLTLEKFGNSSKNLSKLLEIQVSDKFKTGVGFDSQVFDGQEKDSEVKTSESKTKSVSEPLIEDWISNSEDGNETKESIKKVKNNNQAKYPRKSSQGHREGVVLGHKVSEAGLEVEKAKIDIISKLPPPTNIKEIKDRKGTENVAAYDLSRIEKEETSDDNEVDDNFPGETLMEINIEDDPCNKIMEKTMKRYGVNHRFSTSHHPQTSGQVENTNRALKKILEKTVKDNPAIWSRKLDDALWAFRIAYKTPTDTTPYKLIYGKNVTYHLNSNIVHTGP
ncbi:retrovirus-related pol polyprotein from transposon TNT 1-94 [Tanacetum coccineum]